MVDHKKSFFKAFLLKNDEMLTTRHKLVNLLKKEAFDNLSRRIKSKVGVFSFLAVHAKKLAFE